MNLLRSFSTIGFFTLISRITGFIRTILMVNLVGVGAISDALIISIKFPSIMRRIFAEGAFNAAFIPIFSRMLADGDTKSAHNYAENIFSILILTLSIFVLVVEIFMPQILRIILPGFSSTPERLHYVILFSRITFPFILFISICALFSGILNSMERFAYAASSSIVGNMSVIGTVLMLQNFVENKAFTFAIGVAICGVIQSLWVLIPSYRLGFALRLRKPQNTPQLRKFFRMLIPIAAGSGVVQINICLDMFIGSSLAPGGISYLEYADRINQLPLSTIGVAMGTALLPLLSKQLRSKKTNMANDTQNLAIKMALIFAFPATCALLLLAFPIIQTIYPQGKLTIIDVKQIAYTLQMFCLGLPAYVLIKVFNSIYFANQNTRTPIKFAMLSVVLNVILNVIFLQLWAHLGIAMATVISSYVNAFCLLYSLRKNLLLQLKDDFSLFLFKLFSVNSLLFCFLLVVQHYIVNIIDYSVFLRLIALGAVVVISIVFYAGMCLFCKIIRKQDINIILK